VDCLILTEVGPDCSKQKKGTEYTVVLMRGMRNLTVLVPAKSERKKKAVHVMSHLD
jgi:hypothetical protein